MSKLIGERIKMRRKELGYKQAAVAKELGITQGNYSKIENGMIKINAADLQKLANILQISPLFLMETEDELNTFAEDTMYQVIQMYGDNRFKEVLEMVQRVRQTDAFRNERDFIRLLIWEARTLNMVGNVDEAIEILEDVVKNKMHLLNRVDQATAYLSFATAQYNFTLVYPDYPEVVDRLKLAASYAMKAEDVFRPYKDISLRFYNNALLIIGLIWSALTAKTGKVTDFREGEQYLLKTLELANETLEWTVATKGDVYVARAENHFVFQDAEAAIRFTRRAIRYYRIANYVAGQMNAFVNLGKYYTFLNQPHQAKICWDRAYALALKHPSSVLPDIRNELEKLGYSLPTT
ncbi:helix-turn-helix transcriptional regulator [Paenibacillus sp.]|uniref:helix-turn-helix domain-containing protein n=1 Tax=Paenibacillus sp. TaxID=58172 RepID=UPI002D353504|nr:helix-turn-helix transcriptional regulator [Paenibacillus sp.]HZG84331.1 helix-turn-helix transcriptional regulator [Paenibacillus sp.]